MHNATKVLRRLLSSYPSISFSSSLSLSLSLFLLIFLCLLPLLLLDCSSCISSSSSSSLYPDSSPTQAARKMALAKAQPVLIEAMTYRGGHHRSAREGTCSSSAC